MQTELPKSHLISTMSLGPFHSSHGRMLKLSLCAMLLCLTMIDRVVAQTSPPGEPKAKAAGKAAQTPDRNRGKPLPPGVRDYTSRNFLMHTDLPPEDAKELLTRLETMLTLISKYWGKPNRAVIEMYVVKDLSVWPPGSIDGRGLQSIEAGAGVTLGQTAFIGNEAVDAKAVVYSVADRGTPQHEAVHAYCQLNFGRTGPTWYSEGMAEMGQYWKEKDTSVAIHPVVFDYLKKSELKSLDEIIAPGQTTGDSWENYAWRWALCHLLANNTNYASRFRPLGLSLLSSRPGSFELTYGPSAREISFEYDFFLKHLEQGFRADLCSWDWQTKPVAVRGTATVQSKIDAKKGWQASRLLAKAGETYQFTTTGTWKTGTEGEAISPGSAESETGRLAGVLFNDYELSEPFIIDIANGWTAPSDGALYLRCHEGWGALQDNTGTVAVKIKRGTESVRTPANGEPAETLPASKETATGK